MIKKYFNISEINNEVKGGNDMSVNLKIGIDINAHEKFASFTELTTIREWDHEFSFTRYLDGDSSAAVEKAWSNRFNLSSGTYTLDLTDLLDAIGDSLDLTDRKVQFIAIQCPSTNAYPVKVDVGTDGYNFGGSADSEISVQSGGLFGFYWPNTTAAVGASDKNIVFTSDDDDAEVNVIIAAGPSS